MRILKQNFNLYVTKRRTVAAMNKIYSGETVEVKNAFCSKFVNFRCFQSTHLIVVALITPEQNCSIVAFYYQTLQPCQN